MHQNRHFPESEVHAQDLHVNLFIAELAMDYLARTFISDKFDMKYALDNFKFGFF